MFKIKYIDEVEITNKKVLLRVDYNVPLDKNLKITDDTRIIQTLETINLLLQNKNKIIIISHLGRPEKRDANFSLKPVAKRLQELLPNNKITLVDDFLKIATVTAFPRDDKSEILLLENIRFYKDEENNDLVFAKKLSSLGDIYVNDAFAVSHRSDASIVGIPKFIPAYAGLLLKKEINSLSKLLQKPANPYIAIISGIKTETKIPVILKFIEIADTLILGGGVAHTFLKAKGVKIGQSIFDPNEIEIAKQIIQKANDYHKQIILPIDVICAKDRNEKSGISYEINNIPANLTACDIGTQTINIFSQYIAGAKTIVWNGPMGYIENPVFTNGTNSIYAAIINSPHSFSVIGGGDTLKAITDKQSLSQISYVSTGGGAMLEFIEKGTLPGIRALEKTSSV